MPSMYPCLLFITQTAKHTVRSFLQMTSKKAAGGSVINYSSRFTLTGMQGTFTQDVINTLTTVSGTAGPPTVLQAVARAAASEDNFAIPYNQQTGQIKYAPMQPLPPHTITAQNTSPLWPTSSVVIATTPLPIPTVTFTYTQPGTWVFTSHENTVRSLVHCNESNILILI